MIYVLETRGKRESVDNIVLHTFDNYYDARTFITENERPYDKYYRCLEIIDAGLLYNIHGSHGEDDPAEIYKDI